MKISSCNGQIVTYSASIDFEIAIQVRSFYIFLFCSPSKKVLLTTTIYQSVHWSICSSILHIAILQSFKGSFTYHYQSVHLFYTLLFCSPLKEVLLTTTNLSTHPSVQPFHAFFHPNVSLSIPLSIYLRGLSTSISPLIWLFFHLSQPYCN